VLACGVSAFVPPANSLRIDTMSAALVCAIDIRHLSVQGGSDAADLPTIKQTIDGLLAAFPDMTSSEDDLIADGDTVVVRRTLHGTHQGEFMGVAPTDKGVTCSGVWLAYLSHGQLKRTVGLHYT
jgi:predicted ester cyclase